MGINYRDTKREKENIMNLSARNQLKGKIVDILEGAVNGVVVIDIGVNKGIGKYVCSVP